MTQFKRKKPNVGIISDLIARLYSGLKRFWRCDIGSIAMHFAVLSPVLIGATGMALDYAQSYLVQQRLQHAVDQAALAATASSADAEVVDQKVRQFFDANYPEEKLGFTLEPVVTITGDEVSVSAKAIYKTTFLKYVGTEEIDVTAKTVVQRDIQGIEVVLVIDVTGSMMGSKITTLRQAVKDFIETIYSRIVDDRFIRIAIVPYAVTVNVGDIAPSIVNKTDGDIIASILDDDGNVIVDRSNVVYQKPDYSKSSDDKMWAGCVMARPSPYDEAEMDTALGGLWDAYWWEHTSGDEENNYWDSAIDSGASINEIQFTPVFDDKDDCNERRYPNLGCPLTNPIVPLTSNRATLDAAADQITHWCRGGTLSNLGMVWGWRVLSPDTPFTVLNGAPADTQAPAPYDSEVWRKAVVLMTDGENQIWKKKGIKTASEYSAYGYIDEGRLGVTQRGGPEVPIVNDKLKRVCNKMDKQGISIYTVTFGSGVIGKKDVNGQLITDTYRQCASDDEKYFEAATNQELIDAFVQISKELSHLHIKE